MEKLYRLILLFFVVKMITLVGCTSEKKAENTEVKSIQFWHFWSEPYQKKVLDKIIKEFETKTGITVETTELSWNDGKTKLFAAFNSKTAPDVLELGSDWVAQFSSEGVLYSIPSEKVEMSSFIDFSLEPCYWDSQIYSLPWVVDTRVLFVNQELLSKKGITLDSPFSVNKMLEYSESVNEFSEEIYGYGATGPDKHRLYKKIIPLFWTFGGEVFDSKGNLKIDSPENVKALESYLRAARTGIIETQRQLDNLFVRGKIGFWISGGWLLEKIKNENPDLNYSTYLVPGEDNSTGISFAGGEYLAISNQSKQKEAALEFIKYMTSGENSIKFTKEIYEAGYPADKNYYNTDYDMKERKIFSEQLKHAKLTPVHPKWLEIEEIIEKNVALALYGEISAEEAITKANTQITKVLN